MDEDREDTGDIRQMKDMGYRNFPLLSTSYYPPLNLTNQTTTNNQQ